MKIIYGLEVFFPHISGVTIVTNRLAMNFGRQLAHRTWIITANTKAHFFKKTDPRGYVLIRLPSYLNPFRPNFRTCYFARRYIRFLLKEIKPDVIHIQDPLFISQALAREAKKNKIPVILTQHSNLSFVAAYLPKCLQKLGKKIYSQMLVNFINQYIDVVITPTETMKKDILSWGVKRPIKVISNGINLKFFKPGQPNPNFLKKYYLSEYITKPIVLYAGRLDKDKNLNTLMAAIPLVLKEIDCYFIFLGKGNLKDEMEKQAKIGGYFDKLKFLKPISPGDTNLPECYQAATVFVMPSAIEAQSLVTMEAMACGLPVVASRGGALPELIKDKENGLLVDPYQPQAFSQAIIDLLKNPEWAKKMGEKSLEMIQGHNFKLVLKKLADLYEQIIG